jgi:proton-translocating NADH-quinone oxidoreductase chain N
LLPLLILAPLAGLILVNLPLVAESRRAAWWVALALALAQVGASLFAPAEQWNATGPLDQFFSFGLVATRLSRILLISIGLVLASTLLVGRSMLEDRRQRSNFANLLLISLIGMNGAVLVTDLFSLYVFLEVASVGSFVLIAFKRENHGLEGAFKYLILSAVATVLMVGSVAVLMMVSEGTSFEAVHKALEGNSHNAFLAKLAVGSFVCGLLIKGGLVPFHGWLPDAYSAAPAPVSIWLAGIVTKVMGIYGLLRLATSVFTISAPLATVLMLVGAISIVVGALAAIGQTDLKRLLAYSSISQVGYIILGLGCGTPLALVGAVFHLFNHAIFKSLLFVNASALEQRLGTTDLRRLSGLGSRMPVTSTTSIIATLSTAGVPPLAGFWSKLLIIIALWQAGQFTYAAVAVLMSVVTLGYLLIVQRRIFFSKESEEFGHVHEAGPGVVIVELALAALTIGVGLGVPWLLAAFMSPLTKL